MSRTFESSTASMKYCDGVLVVRLAASDSHQGCELHDVLLALAIDDVAAEAPFGHEHGVSRDLTSALQHLARAQGPGTEQLFHERELFL